MNQDILEASLGDAASWNNVELYFENFENSLSEAQFQNKKVEYVSTAFICFARSKPELENAPMSRLPLLQIS